MLTPEEQMQLLKEALVQGYKGPIYKLIDEANIRKGVTAQTESQQKQGLLGSDGNTAMAFPNSDDNFNTEGMDFPIDVRKYDKEGNLVRSYNKVPPGIKELDMGEEEGTVIETPSKYQKGGFNDQEEEDGNWWDNFNIFDRDGSGVTIREMFLKGKKDKSSKLQTWEDLGYEPEGTEKDGKYLHYTEEGPQWFDHPVKLTLEQKISEGLQLDNPDINNKYGYDNDLSSWVPKEKIPTIPKLIKKKTQKFTPIESIQAQQLPVDDSMSLAESGIKIDKDKYKYSKYYKDGEYKVKVIDKSKKGKSDDIQTVDDLSLPAFNQMYKKQTGGIAIKSEKNPIKINSYQEGGSKIPEGFVPPPGLDISQIPNTTYTSDKIEESRKAPWHSNLIQGSQPTPGGDYSLPSVPTWRKFETSKIGKAINAKRFRKGKDKMFEALGYEEGRQIEGTVDALNWLPYAGEAIDAYSTVEDLTNKDYLGATLSATGFALPFVPGRAVKKGFNKLKDKTKSLYRVVDAPDIETARKYAGTVGGTGRRTGSEMTRIQQTTPFDNISTTTDQSWILGNKNIVGGDNLFDRYGGENPFVARLKPRTTNVATTYGKNVDELAKIPPGSITDMNVTGPGGQNITNIMGPKGSEVLDVEEVLSKADYLKRHNIDPNFKWGVRASPNPVGEGKKVYRSTYLKSLLKGERTREEKEEKARGEYVTKLGTYEDENIKRKGGVRKYQEGGGKETTEEYNTRIMDQYYNRLQEHSDSTASYNKAVIIDDLYNEGQDFKNEALKVMLDAIKYEQEDPVAFDKEHGCGKGFFRDARGKCIEGNIKGNELIKKGKVLEEDLRKTGIYPTEKKKLVNTGDSEYTYTTTAESIKPGPVPKKPMEKITSIGPELLSILNKEPKVEKSKRTRMRSISDPKYLINLQTGEKYKSGDPRKKDGTWVGRQFKKLINRGPGKRRGPTNLVTGQPGELGELGYQEGGMRGMMKSKIAYESQFGNNPAINRMLAPTDEPYEFSPGNTGTHFMGSHGKYAIPHIQDVGGKLKLTGPRKDEAIKFHGPRAVEDATYFAEHYKDVAPAFQKQTGGFNPANLNPTPYNPIEAELDKQFPLRNTPFPQGRRSKPAPWEIKKGIRAVESADGKLMKNPKSSATGLYGQLYNEIKDLPMMEDINRDAFAADTTLQNEIFDMRWRGELPGIPGLKSNIKKLRKDYKNETSTFTDNELAALSNFTGRDRARKYFAALKKGKEFKMPKGNKTVEEYMEEYREAISPKISKTLNIEIPQHLKKLGGYKSKSCW